MDIRDLVSPPSTTRARYGRQRRRESWGASWGASSRVSRGDLRFVILAGIAIGLAVPGAEWLWRGGAGAPVVSVARVAGGDGASADAGSASGTGGGAAGVVRAFGQCHRGGGVDCVVDGDTFWIDGEKIRIADIDAPETHPSRCAEEARLGNAATDRLQALLNAGPVTLVTIDRDTDRYGRKLRVVERGGVSLGDMLVSEGLARPWEGRRRPWC